MPRVLLVVAVSCLTLAASLVSARDEAGRGGRAATKSGDVFGPTKLWRLRLEVPAKEYSAMEPIGGARFPGMPNLPGGPRPGGGPGAAPGGPATPAKKPADTHKGGGFGFEFPWVRGQMTADGTNHKNLAIRYKGNASYLASARGLRRNLKIEFDRYDKKGRFHGLKTISLNAGAMDPTRGREALAYALFRAAGVPAPRTAFAEVSLTVPGKYDGELLGLYTIVEQVDKTFLKDRFKTGGGLLMKPDNVRSMDYLGEEWDRYKARYKPKREASKAQAQRVMDFARLVHKADDATFRKEVGSYLDIEQFLRFTAVNAWVANIDSLSFFEFGHNYYLYLNPKTNKFVFIPWDLDLSLAGFPMGASPDEQMDLSVTRPYAGEHRLIGRLLAMKDVNQKYQQILKELAATCLSKERLLKDVESIETTTKTVLAREAKATAARKEGPSGFGPRGGMSGRSPDMRTFVTKRTESVAAQLDGKNKGHVIAKAINPFGGGRLGGGRPGGRPGGFPGGGAGGFPGGGAGGFPGGGAGGFPGGGPGGFGMQMPRPGEVLPAFLQESLKLTEKQKKQVAALQKDVDARVEKILTADQKAQLKKLREARPGGFPGGGAGGFPGRPGKGSGRPAPGGAGGFPGGGAGGFPGGGAGGFPGGGAGGFPGGGPGGFGMQMPRPGEVLPAFLQESLKLTEKQKKQVAALQKDVDAQVEKILTADQRAQLKKLREARPGGFPGGGAGGFPGGGAGGFPGGGAGGFPGGGAGGFPGGGAGGFPGGGPGGFGMQMPRPGEVLPAFLQESLKLTEKQKKQVAALQKDVDARVEKILTADQKAQLKKLREARPGGRPGGFPGGGPGGFPGGGAGGFPGGGAGGFPGRPGKGSGRPAPGDRAEAARIIDKAIAAHGGAEKLAKLPAASWKARGSFTGPTGAQNFTEEIAVHFPKKSRFDVNVGNQFRFVAVLNGDKGWAKFGPQAREMDKTSLAEIKENLYADWLASVAPLSDKAFALTSLGESKVGDRPVLGVKVAREGHRDVQLYFDKETGLLAKRATRAKDLFQGGVEFNEELIYSEYKEFNGVKRPTKVRQLKDGKVAMESTLSDYKLAEKLDDKLFSRPE